ncbi:hypothetical protein SCLCIDRAFT_1212931 [Scleroderma citrinum Foug A]|uniref:Uncharacterized protein n=1 Tax=Scleroderma citrinum Foug A TaxID=1036808 RepID=A0A0C3E8Y2_9AGAM|nr:hypothetical protein SCLCIDRAFT_1212931 [Scleroderma citrinum Foug A]
MAGALFTEHAHEEEIQSNLSSFYCMVLREFFARHLEDSTTFWLETSINSPL